jgi:hypothetical protein
MDLEGERRGEIGERKGRERGEKGERGRGGEEETRPVDIAEGMMCVERHGGGRNHGHHARPHHTMLLSHREHDFTRKKN